MKQAKVSAPVITPSKGGGAIRGIGEKFTANPVTGTASMSVPIAISPSRGEFHPELALSYDSGVGNGPFGFGWQLALPAITRSTDKGLPRYGLDDAVVLSGAEELVPAFIEAGGGAWQPDEVERLGYRIRRFRPRIEGMFARIERWTRLADGDNHWRSISRENVLTVYGFDAASRIADPQDPGRVFSWRICASYDHRGNAIVYDYMAETGANVDLTKPSEHNRSRGANRYLSRVRYGNRVPLLLDTGVEGFRPPHVPEPDFDSAGWMFEVVFDYDPQPRRDSFSSYRAGFEVRTHRLCREVQMRHHFPEELGVDDYLVRSTRFSYDDTPLASFLRSVVSSGHVRQSGGGYLTRAMPALEFDYSRSPLADPGYDGYLLRDVTEPDLPEGVDGGDYRWVDLDGEGIAGVLSGNGGGWRYQPNLGGGRFGPSAPVASIPAAASGQLTQLVDLAGDGQLDLVTFDPGGAGFHEREGAAGWGSFRSFRSWPTVAWTDPNLRFVDLTGDGHTDVLITEDECLRWHPSLAEEGFDAAIRLRLAATEEDGPRVVFSNAEQSVHLADLSGDGLTDIVRIRNGEVCYWPNLGYGRFGGKVTMDNPPIFDRPERFDPRRIRFADTDGSGVSDLIYVGPQDIRVFLNESGNAWSSARVFAGLDVAGSSVAVLDLLGRGTACLVWSSPQPGHSRRPMRYLDLTDGRKPHLLVEVRNNLGAQTFVEYASSTEFYLADKLAGQPWATTLPFPVHVVKRVVVYDHVGRNRFVTSYAYHHGHFDGDEREFRGFGRVDQLDTEEFAALAQGEPFSANTDIVSHVPPVLTKTWYHTGAYVAGQRISRHLAAEYHDGVDALADTVLPEGISAAESREACRALKGLMLRREIYALDSGERSTRPYAVLERNYGLRPLQPRLSGQHAVFLPHPREALDQHHERLAPADPRTGHAFTLEVDDFGSVLLSATVNYGRRTDDPDPRLTDADRLVQRTALATMVTRSVTAPVVLADAWRVPMPCETSVYELHHLDPAGGLFTFGQLRALIAKAGDGAHDLPHEDFAAAGASAGEPFRRLLRRERVIFRRNDLTGPLPLGQVQSLALPYDTHRLALTTGLAQRVYVDSGKLAPVAMDATLVGECRYVHSEGDPGWWAPTQLVHYTAAPAAPAAELAQAAADFFVARRFTDPFGNASTVGYDSHRLLAVSSRDAVGNVTGAVNDYRVLQPVLVTDPNGNRQASAFDACAMVVGTALMGKASEAVGDSLAGFQADLSEPDILAFLADPAADPLALLGRASTRTVYDLHAFARTGSAPAVVCALAREVHDSDEGGAGSPVQIRLSYSDGFGHEIQHKTRAESGQWIGSGWTVRNNKGGAVRTYEPFFDTDHGFAFAHLSGVGSISHFDPLQRQVAVLHPHRAWGKVVLHPWRQEAWDEGDTALIANPATDPDVGDFFARLPTMEYQPTWHGTRAAGALGPHEQAAAATAARYAGTPTLSALDPLGRAFLTVAHERTQYTGESPSESFLRTRTRIDVAGNKREITDSKQRVVARYDYDLLGRRLHAASMEAGARWDMLDVTGEPVRRWDSRGHIFSFSYDGLRRPTRRTVRGTTAASDPRTLNRDVLFEKVEYGEGAPDDTARNLRTRVRANYDGAGVDYSERYDFKGNLVQCSRRYAVDYKQVADWSLNPALQDRAWENRATVDALNRAVALTTPDGSVTRLGYSQRGLINSIGINLRGAQTPTTLVSEVSYNARGQATLVRLGNEAAIGYTFDPFTFRTTRITTTRPANPDTLASQLFVDSSRVQDLNYTFDPVGNVTRVSDDALRTVFHQNAQVEPVSWYTYDALYRLIEAAGREHTGQSVWNPQPAQLGDPQAIRRYSERYRYDEVGNLLQMGHAFAGGGWQRSYVYAEQSLLETGVMSNRLSRTMPQSAEGGVPEPYLYDEHGSMVRMPHLPGMQWDFKGQLRSVTRQAVNGGGGAETTYYVYTGGGERARKVTERATGTRRADRLYLRGVELFGEYGGDGVTVTASRWTLHVMLGKRRVALADMQADSGPVALRYQLANHLDSATAELDESAALVTYEEYTPYGAISYQAGRSAAEVSLRRFRFTGRERDDETGLSSHGLRLYCTWLGRWISCDPAGLVDGTNLYQYARANPCRLRDTTGTQSVDEDAARVPDQLPKDAADGKGEGNATSYVTQTQRSAEKKVQAEGGEVATVPPDPAGSQTQPAGKEQPPASKDSAPEKKEAKDTEKPFLYRVTKIDYTNWKQRNGWSYFFAGLFIAVALLFIIPTARLNTRKEPLWFTIFKIAGTAVAIGNAAYRAIKDFGAEKGSKAEQVAAAGDAKPLDLWSVVHWSAGAVMGLWQVPAPIMAITTVLWEGVEISVPGFGDQEINWNRINDIVLAWLGWWTFASFAAAFTDSRVPWGVGKGYERDYTEDRLYGVIRGE